MIFTFYSFKGGVGRSMAVAGIANLFARHGLRVLVVDFDLEAPGIERYFFDAEESRRVREGPGLIDLLTTYKRALTSEAEFARAEFKRWHTFVTEAIPRAGESGGVVDLITAGRREPQEKLREYALRVRTFDWQDFFDNWKGDSFFDWLRRQLTGPMPGYDVVLVDSRTGVTEMGGICAYQLADVAVMLCAANYQNLEGTVAVANDFRSDAVLALRRGRPLDVLIIPARLEDKNPGLEAFLERFEELFASSGLPKVLADCGLNYRGLALPYNPEFAVGERLVGDANVQPTQLAATFERLADALTLLAAPDSKLSTLRKDALLRLTGAPESASAEIVADPTRGSAGYDIFIDAASEDTSGAAKLADRLEHEGFRVFFPQMVSGAADSEPLLERAIDYSECLLLIFGHSTNSSSREQLINKARAGRRTRILPVLFTKDQWTPSALRSFGLDLRDAVDLSDRAGDTEFQRLITFLRSRRDLTIHASISTERNPYPGGRPFSEDEAGFFFGREQEIEAVLKALNERNIVFVIGPSGVGKTSLVNCGVLSQVRGRTGLFEQHAPWQIIFIDLSSAGALNEQITSKHRDAANLIVLDSVDAFPRDGYQAARDARTASIRTVLDRASPTCKFVLIMRGAFSNSDIAGMVPSQCAQQSTSVFVAPLSEKALRDAIERPAGKQGHLLEPGLADRLISDAGVARSAVGQIQLVMPAIWKERRRGWLTNKAYEHLGKIAAAFDSRRKNVLEAENAEFRKSAEVLFRNLMRLNNALEFVPEQKPWSALATVPGIRREDGAALRDRLADAGLIELWSDNDELLCGLSRQEAESYATQPRADAAFFIWRRQFGSLVEHWLKSGRADDALISGGALAEAERLLQRYSDQVTSDEYDLINSSLEKRAAEEKREKEENRRRTRVLHFEVIAAVAAACVVLLLYIYARKQQAHAARDATLAVLTANSDANPTAAALALSDMLDDSTVNQSTTLSSIARLDVAHLYRAALRHETAVFAAKFSPDGKIVLTVSANTARLWDGEGKAFTELIGHSAAISDAAFSPDSKMVVTASFDGTARLWDRAGKLIVELKQPKQKASAGNRSQDSGDADQLPLVQHADFSPDGQMIVTASSDSKARLWNLSGKLLSELKGHKGWVSYAAFSPDGKTVGTASLDSTGRLWDLDGNELGVLRGHTGSVGYIAFSPDGRQILTASADSTARLWDPNGKLIREFKGHIGPILHAEFSPDGQMILTCSTDSTARLWSHRDDAAIATLTGHRGPVVYATFNPKKGEKTIATASMDGTARIWDFRGNPIAELKGHLGPIQQVAFSPDGQTIATASLDKTARLWIRRGTALVEIRPHSAPVKYATYSPDWGSSLILDGSDTVQLQHREGRALAELKGHTGPVGYAAFSPDGKLIVTVAADKTGRLWDREGRALAELKGHTGPVGYAAFSPDGKLIVTVAADKTGRLWDREGRALAELKGHTGPVGYAAFSPDGKLIITISADKTAKLWNNEGVLIKELNRPSALLWHAAFSLDGSTIVTASSDSTAQLWSREGNPIRQLKGHSAPVTYVAFSPDGKTIVTTSGDRTARIWSVDGTTLAEFGGHSADVVYASFGRSGQILGTVSADGVARLWPIGSQAFSERIRSIAARCLTREERRLYLPGETASETARKSC
jgi:WD40 repeat protein